MQLKAAGDQQVRVVKPNAPRPDRRGERRLMKLSAEQFAELASSFGATESDDKHEQRRAARMELHARVKITPLEASGARKVIDVAICDFSPRGIAFLRDCAMQSGQQFLTQLPGKSGGSVWLLCEVRHCEAANESLCRKAAEFRCTVQQPPADAYEKLLQIRQTKLS